MNVEDHALSPVDIPATSTWHTWDGQAWSVVVPPLSIRVQCPPEAWKEDTRRRGVAWYQHLPQPGAGTGSGASSDSGTTPSTPVGRVAGATTPKTATTSTAATTASRLNAARPATFPQMQRKIQQRWLQLQSEQSQSASKGACQKTFADMELDLEVPYYVKVRTHCKL